VSIKTLTQLNQFTEFSRVTPFGDVAGDAARSVSDRVDTDDCGVHDPRHHREAKGTAHLAQG
jgi:hypothetical protein